MKTREVGLIMVATTSPCEQCAGLVINTRRIGFFIYGSMYRDLTGLERLKQAGVVCLSLSETLAEWPYSIGRANAKIVEGAD